MTRRKPGFYLHMQFFDSWNRAASVVAGPYTSVDKAFDATIANRNYSGAYTASTLYQVDEQGHESAIEGHPRHRKERENWQEWREEQRRREQQRDSDRAADTGEERTERGPGEGAPRAIR